MKLNYDRKSKDPTYFIQVGIRNGKKVTTKNVERIGKHSELLKITDDPLEYAKQRVKEYNENIKSSKVEYNITVNFDDKVINQGNTVSKSTCKNTGYFYLKELYSYIFEVKDSTEKIINSLSYDELKKKISEERKEYLKSLKVVSDDKNAIWLIDYWCGKDIRGLIQMPFLLFLEFLIQEARCIL